MRKQRTNAVLALVAAAALFAAATGDTRAAPQAKPPAPIAKIVKRIAVPGRGGVAAGGGAVWATDETGRLHRIDPATNRVVVRIPIRTEAPQLCCAFGFGAVWLTDVTADTLVRVSAQTNTVVARIPVGRTPIGAAVGFGSVWVASNRGAAVVRVDPGANRVTARIRVGTTGEQRPYGNGPLSVAVAGGAVWASVPNSGTVVRIDPRSERVTATFRVPRQCVLTARGASVYAAAACGASTISRIDARAGRIAARRSVGDVPGPVAVLGRYLWAVTFSGNVVRLNAQTLRPAGRMRLRGLNVEGESLATSRGAVWVRAEGFVVRLRPR